MSRMFAREQVLQNAVAKTGNLDSSQLTHLKSAPKTLDRTNYTPNTPMDVKRAVHRVRSSGTVAPKKKNAVVQVAFTVTYDRNGALSGGPVDTYRYGRGSRVVVAGPGNLVFPPTSVFLAWNTNPSGTGFFLFPGNTFVISQNTTLYAIQQSSSTFWNIVYELNSGTATGEQTGPQYLGGATATVLDQGSMVNPGFVFLGWSTDDSATVPDYPVGFTFVMPASNVTLYAVWELRGPDQVWLLNASYQVGLNFVQMSFSLPPFESFGRTCVTLAETGGVDTIVQTNSFFFFGQFLSTFFNQIGQYIPYPNITGIFRGETWTWRQYATVSTNSTVTLSFKFYLFHGDTNTQDLIGQSPQSAPVSTTLGDYVDFSYTFPDLTVSPNDRFMVELYQKGTGAGTLSTFFEGELYSVILVQNSFLGPFYFNGVPNFSLTPPPGPGGGFAFFPNSTPTLAFTFVSSVLGNPVLRGGVATQTLNLLLQSDPPNQVSFYFNLYKKNNQDELTLIGTSTPSTETGTAFSQTLVTSRLIINENIPLKLDDRIAVEYVFTGTGELVIINLADATSFLVFS